ncbi:hypothetical protein P5673_023936 [Acropora cervicornis]|uniref:Uncharacterized protein n=1 Tax=Acropora cervicornis TaxID=6130 RepID=A0AAD9UYC7_ACRCE|nr:hypothetical protein P5673_023936 [Acropora cervicornis]
MEVVMIVRVIAVGVEMVLVGLVVLLFKHEKRAMEIFSIVHTIFSTSSSGCKRNEEDKAQLDKFLPFLFTLKSEGPWQTRRRKRKFFYQLICHANLSRKTHESLQDAAVCVQDAVDATCMRFIRGVLDSPPTYWRLIKKTIEENHKH